MTLFGKASAGDKADVSGADHANFHLATSNIIGRAKHLAANLYLKDKDLGLCPNPVGEPVPLHPFNFFIFSFLAVREKKI
jgi:hypothetical protein